MDKKGLKMGEDESKCAFCENAATELRKQDPSWIADLQVSTAFLARNQICRGYTILVFNRAHVTELFQLDRKDLMAYSEDLVTIAGAIHAAYNPDKMNYELLGNVVPHLHWHVIPRQKTDPIDRRWPIWGKDYAEVRISNDECGEIVEEIRKHLA
jgi:diadenosine tetraphosphate (Ap4A) HIT family hydrolase